MITIDYVSLGIGAGAGIIIFLILFFLFKPKKKGSNLESIFELIKFVHTSLSNAQKENIKANEGLNILYETFKDIKK